MIDFLTFVNIGRSFPHFGGFQADNLADVDVGVLVDVDVPWIPVATKDNPSTFWAQIDVDVLKSGSPMWSFPANLRIQGKSSRVLTQLLAALQKSASSDFTAAAGARIQRLTAEQSKRAQQIAALAANKGQEGQINPHYVCAEIGKSIGPDDIVINEAVTRQSIPNMQIARPKPGTMISNAGGGLGASGGTALGVKLALPDRCVVQIVGDGSFYFNNPTAVFALGQAVPLPILTVVLDNSGWAAVKGATLRVYPEGQAKAKNLYQADLPTDMDFSKIVEAAGRLWRTVGGSGRSAGRHRALSGGSPYRPQRPTARLRDEVLISAHSHVKTSARSYIAAHAAFRSGADTPRDFLERRLACMEEWEGKIHAFVSTNSRRREQARTARPNVGAPDAPSRRSTACPLGSRTSSRLRTCRPSRVLRCSKAGGRCGILRQFRLFARPAR